MLCTYVNVLNKIPTYLPTYTIDRLCDVALSITVPELIHQLSENVSCPKPFFIPKLCPCPQSFSSTTAFMSHLVSMSKIVSMSQFVSTPNYVHVINCVLVPNCVNVQICVNVPICVHVQNCVNVQNCDYLPTVSICLCLNCLQIFPKLFVCH